MPGMESPNTKKEGNPDLKRRDFLSKTASILLAGAIPVIAGGVTKPAEKDSEVLERFSEPEKSRDDLEIENKLNYIEEAILRHLDAQDIEDIVGGLPGSSLGFRRQYREEILDMDIRIRDRVTEWIDKARREGHFKTEESTKAAIAERINALKLRQEEIRNKLEKM